jgi:hypothetical protein
MAGQLAEILLYGGVVAELGLPEDSRGRHGRVSVSA